MEPARRGSGAEPPDAARRRRARPWRLPRIQLRWSSRSIAALVAFQAATVATFWAGGLARGRVAGVAACWIVQVVATLRLSPRGASALELGASPPGALLLGVVRLLTSGAAAALTGGLASPLLVTLVMPAMTSVALFATARECRILVVATVACIALLGVVPAGTAGLPDALAELVAGASVLVTLVVVGRDVVRLRAALAASSRELAAAREELATHALARARSLEEVGSQVAHELKNPLSAVKALAHLGAGDAGAAGSRRGFGAIEGEVARMQEILRAYMSFARPVEELRGRRDAPPTPASNDLRWPRKVIAIMATFDAVAVGAVWAASLPGWRVAGIAAVCLVQVARTLRFAPRVEAARMLTAYPPPAFRLQLVHVGSATAWSLLTGGLQSPFLMLLLGPVTGSLALYPDAWQTRVLVAVLAGCVLLLGVAPESVTGAAPAGAAAAVLASASALMMMLIVGAMLTHIRDRLRATAGELSRAREELAALALARVRSLEEVGAKVARELEAPLAEVRTLARLGAEREEEAREREWFEVVGREAARMQGILADYRSFARPLEAFRPEPVELGPLVADVLAVLSGRAARAGVREASRGDASVTADPRRLKEALLNLVSNAIDATPAGGRVEVDVGSEAGAARIVIRDTGRGMGPDVLARVGTPFFTTREAGTGLGVVLARSVFRRHGGGLRYESAPGLGTTVTATLPC